MQKIPLISRLLDDFMLHALLESSLFSVPLDATRYKYLRRFAFMSANQPSDTPGVLSNSIQDSSSGLDAMCRQATFSADPGMKTFVYIQNFLLFVLEKCL